MDHIILLMSALTSQVEFRNVSLVGRTHCPFDPISEAVEWATSACCNESLIPVQCCAPYTADSLLPVYTGVSDATLLPCGSSSCARTFYDDYGLAISNLDDPIRGCTASARSAGNLLQVSQEGAETYLRPCTVEVGFGEDYTGLPCVEDSDCVREGAAYSGLSGNCDMNRGVCALISLVEVEDLYLQCFIARMDTSLAVYIRTQVLSPSSPGAKAPLDSPAFFAALKEAAAVSDCVNPTSPLDLSARTRYVYDAASQACKNSQLGLAYPEDNDKANAICPPVNCLGDTCPVPGIQCYVNCVSQYRSVTATAASCAAVNAAVGGDKQCRMADGLCNDEFACIYCPEDESSPCIVDNTATTLLQCEASVACELPGGAVEFGWSEEECSLR